MNFFPITIFILAIFSIELNGNCLNSILLNKLTNKISSSKEFIKKISVSTQLHNTQKISYSAKAPSQY